MKEISKTAIIEMALELSQGLTANDRFDRLVSTIRKTIHCEAVALLQKKHGFLVPLAQQGLSSDMLGRRFDINAHPRFDVICNSDSPVRFDKDCELPDPYDCLMLDSEENLPIHACMGLPLYFEQNLLGVLTLDSLNPQAFDSISLRELELIASMASASLNASMQFSKLEHNYNHSLKVVAELTQSDSEQYELIGESEPMDKLKQDIKLVASSDFTVLVQGQSGVGKELVVHNIHKLSNRSSAPLVYVNCAALPTELIESELFGHIKGAFTGADKTRAGKFVLADGGTLFLDEVGELPLTLQSKLLRAIQSNEIQVVGQDKITKVNVRVVAATNRDLALEVSEKRFREDLYHRLNVYPIKVPTLAQRRSDIPLFIGYFAEKLKRQLGVGQIKFLPSTVRYLKSYDWPGNVRELEHCISRATLKASIKVKDKKFDNVINVAINDCDVLDTVETKKINEKTHIEVVPNQDLRQAVDTFQRELIIKVLKQEQGNVSRASRLLGVDRANLSRLIKRLAIHIEKHIEVN